MTMRMGVTEWGLLILLSLLWGGVFFLNEIALTGFGPFSVVLGRVGFAALALTVLLPVVGVRFPLAPGLWVGFLVMGALNNAIPFTLIVWGQTHIESGLAAILNATTPLFTVLIAHVATRDERFTPNRIAGVVLGLIGVAVLIGTGALASFSWHSLGQIAVLGAALSYACAGVFGRRFSSLSPIAAAAGMLWASTLLMTPVTLFVETPWQTTAPLAPWLAVIGLALAGSAAAYVVYFALLARAGATNLLLVTFLLPVIAVVLGYVLLNERLAWNDWAGMALILAGLLAVDGRIASRFGTKSLSKENSTNGLSVLGRDRSS